MNSDDLTTKKFLIGQRVIIAGNEIGTVEKSPLIGRLGRVWVFSPSRGHSCEFDIDNIQPLPNGQL